MWLVAEKTHDCAVRVNGHGIKIYKLGVVKCESCVKKVAEGALGNVFA